MSLVNLVKRADIRITLTVIGVLVAGFGLYATLREDKPHISFEMINTTNILDVREPVEELTILFQGEDIQKENLNLRIIAVKVENDGGIDILQNRYDRDDVLGLELFDGEIIEARLTGGNSDYIESNLNPTLKSKTNIIEFEKLIFERGKYFIIEMLVLHDKQVLPRIVPIGKIAGIEKFETVERIESEISLVEQLFYGSAWIQIIRVVIYFIGGLLIVIVAVVIAIAVEDPINRKRSELRRKRFSKLLIGINEIEKSKYAKQFDVLADIYAIGGSRTLKTASDLLKDTKRSKSTFEWALRIEREARLDENETTDGLESEVERTVPVRWMTSTKDLEIMEKLVKENMVKKGKGDKPVIDKNIKKYLDKLTSD